MRLPCATPRLHRRHHPVKRDRHGAHRVRDLERLFAHPRLELGALRLPTRRERLGQSVQRTLRGRHVPQHTQHLLGLARHQVSGQHRAVTRRMRRPVPFDDAYGAPRSGSRNHLQSTSSASTPVGLRRPDRLTDSCRSGTKRRARARSSRPTRSASSEASLRGRRTSQRTRQGTMKGGERVHPGASPDSAQGPRSGEDTATKGRRPVGRTTDGRALKGADTGSEPEVDSSDPPPIIARQSSQPGPHHEQCILQRRLQGVAEPRPQVQPRIDRQQRARSSLRTGIRSNEGTSKGSLAHHAHGQVGMSGPPSPPHRLALGLSQAVPRPAPETLGVSRASGYGHRQRDAT